MAATCANPGHPRVRPPVHGGRHPSRRQGRRDDPPGQRARPRQLDPHLDVRDVVQVEHDVRAAALHPARPQARPHLVQEPPHNPGNSCHVVAAATTAVGRAATSSTLTS
ncbi:hypothetical protein [Nonomuraea rhizosphaerae]|uniref:hypothetical protein n=1 Tax=Nonomuraea rhizosphaerae TaxID=2665663 RepID=UPI001C5E4206|nr:hypothetical protein [Nonomuraea rhizosphaerae]